MRLNATLFTFLVMLIGAGALWARPAPLAAAEDNLCQGYPPGGDAFVKACQEFIKTHPGGDIAARDGAEAQAWLTCPSGISMSLTVKVTSGCNLGPGTGHALHPLTADDVACAHKPPIWTQCLMTGYTFCRAGGCSDENLPCHFEKDGMRCGETPAAVSGVMQPPAASPPAPATSFAPASALHPADVPGDNCKSYETYSGAFFHACTAFMAKHPGGD